MTTLIKLQGKCKCKVLASLLAYKFFSFYKTYACPWYYSSKSLIPHVLDIESINTGNFLELIALYCGHNIYSFNAPTSSLCGISGRMRCKAILNSES